MSLINFLENIFLFFNSNPVLYCLLCIFLLNFFFPAGVIILFTLASFDLSIALILCILILISSSALQYSLSVNYYSIIIKKFYPSVLQLRDSIDDKSSSWSQIIIRSISLPYIVQNFLCISLARNFFNYIIINLLVSSIWVVIFYFFSESILHSNIYGFASIVILIILISLISRKYLYKLLASNKK
jgi:hypothetical protein